MCDTSGGNDRHIGWIPVYLIAWGGLHDNLDIPRLTKTWGKNSFGDPLSHVDDLPAPFADDALSKSTSTASSSPFVLLLTYLDPPTKKTLESIKSFYEVCCNFLGIGWAHRSYYLYLFVVDFGV